MHPPEYVCRAIYDLNPEYRLAWDGYQGKFIIVGLANRQAVGSLDNPQIIKGFWDVKTTLDPITREEVVVGADPGPIFSRKGIPYDRDWDTIRKVPVREWAASPAMVMSGYIIKEMRDRLKPHRVIEIESDEADIQFGRDYYNTIQDVARKTQESWKYVLKGNYHSAPKIARKHFKQTAAYKYLAGLKEKIGGGPEYYINKFRVKRPSKAG